MLPSQSEQTADATGSPEMPVPDRPDPDDVRVVYQVAMATYAYEGAQVWTRFSAMLVAHSILIVVIGQLLTLDPTSPFRLFAKALAVAGFLVSLLWLMITVRGFRYHDIFLQAAKKQEARLSAGFLQDSRFSRASWFDYIGWFRTRTITYCVIVLFVLTYLLLLYLLLT
jgi:hypothetical protein